MSLNPYVKWPTKITAPSAAYPYGSAQNITVPGDGTGTPWDEDLVNDIFGFQQELLDKAGITPSGDPDEVDDSEYFQAMRATCGYPGTVIATCTTATPFSLGLRVLPLDGTVLLIANYPDLVEATYVGDIANGASTVFIKTSDAGGTTPDTGGTYFVLPDFTGCFIRGRDQGATIDPDGASRFQGDLQAEEIENHYHAVTNSLPTPVALQTTTDNTAGGAAVGIEAGAGATRLYAYTESPSLPLGDETRPTNCMVSWGIWY